MTRKNTLRKQPIPAESADSRTFWFLRLELAVDRGDFQAALEAQEQLRRLGVHVTYGQPTNLRLVGGANG